MPNKKSLKNMSNYKTKGIYKKRNGRKFQEFEGRNRKNDGRKNEEFEGKNINKQESEELQMEEEICWIQKICCGTKS